MSKPFDVTVKHLVEAHPADCVALLGEVPTGPVEVIDADLATVSAEADKVVRVGGPAPWLVHLEFQSSYDSGLGGRSLRYNVLLAERHELPVQSAVILLRPAADGPAMTGAVERKLPNGRRYLEFHYDVVRLWQLPVETLLTRGIGMLPLAPLADVSPEALPELIQRMDARLSREVDPAEAATLWTATFVLMGLRYPQALATQLLQGVRAMKESATYQAIIEEGKALGIPLGKQQGLKEALLRLGTRRFGPPDTRTSAALQAVADLAELERLEDRLLDVSSWQELLAGSAAAPAKGSSNPTP